MIENENKNFLNFKWVLFEKWTKGINSQILNIYILESPLNHLKLYLQCKVYN